MGNPQAPTQMDAGHAMTEQLDPHDPKSRLLETEAQDLGPQPTEDSRYRIFTGYNDDVRALGVGNVGSSDELSKLSTPVLWKGLSFYGWIRELPGILLSVCFLVLGAFVADLKDKPESPWSNRIVQATKLAPSIWPIVFSSVLGNALRTLADWRLERGVELLELEQLLGSLTMGSSVITIFRWSIFQVSSAALVLLWAFNPLGSQASFRGVHLRHSTGITQGLITFYNASLTTQLSQSSFCCGSTRSKPTIRALFSTTLFDYISSTQYVDLTDEKAKEILTMLGGESSAGIQGAMDPWGNVRIPNLEYFSGYDAKNPHRWLASPWDKRVLNYSSLLGDRVDGVNRTLIGNTTFPVSSSYQQFSCSPWFHLNASDQTANKTYSNNTEADVWLIRNTGYTYADLTKPSSRTMMPRTFFVSHLLPNMTTKPNTSEIVFGSRGSALILLYMTKCTARTMYVDVNVTCISRGTLGKAICGVGGLRETPNPPANPSHSILDNYTHSGNTFSAFIDFMDDNQVGSGQSSSIEQYLYNPLSAFSNRMLATTYTELGTVDIATFERRFSLLWNTLWKLGWATKTATGGKLASLEWAGGKADMMLVNATSNVTFPLPLVYTVNSTWLTLYFVAVSIMFAAAVLTLFVRWRCQAPTLLGYVSSLIRDSTYFEDCGIYKNSVEDGPEMTKRLRGIKIMVADVSGGRDEAGKIALAPVGMGKSVKKGKWYI